MNRRELTHLVAVLAFAIAVRVLLFDKVGIWGDYGFYQYDARLILDGGTPFIDFLGRSPLFLYMYAAAAAVFGHTIELVRVVISFWWLLTALPVYAITRRIHSHPAAITAVLVLLVSPFALSYSMWANTQSLAAFLATLAIYVLVRHQQRDGTPYLVAGWLLGLAYLSRRSVFVVMGAVGVYTVYYQARYATGSQRVRARRIVMRGSAMVAGVAVALAMVYGAMARGDLHQMWALFDVHSVNLFLSYGRGGYPLITADAPIVTNSVDAGRIPIFNAFCQVCGTWTARTFAKTISIAVPAVAILWYYIRDWTDHYFATRDLQYMYGSLGALALYATAATLWAGYYARAGVVVCLALTIYYVYQTDAIPRDILYDRDLQLVLLVLVALTAGYLYRNRVLHTYYFMDFWPYLSVVTGILFWTALQRADSRHLRATLAAAIVVGSIAGASGAYPVTVILLEDNRSGWFTIDNLNDYQDDINSRTDPGDVIFTASPSYVANTHAKAPMDRPRIHMVAVRYKDYGPALPQYRWLIDGMRNGTVEYVIFTRTTRQMLRWNDTARQAYEENYCRVTAADDLYQQTNAYLYKYTDDPCPPARQPDMDIQLSAPNATSPP